MPRWPIDDDELREMYRGGKANDAAKWFVRLWSRVFATGVGPRRLVTLELRGRRTGQQVRIPMVLADVDGRWYLVSMLGECNWVKNLRAAGGQATLAHGRSRACSTVEVPVADRGPILQRYVKVANGARPHIPVSPGSPVAQFQAIAEGYPAFELFTQLPDGRLESFRPSRSWVPGALGAAAASVVLMRLARSRCR
jgi:hypothetical protein